MGAPTKPYTPYASVHGNPLGPGDARPTALDIIKENDKLGKFNGRSIVITGTTSGIGLETAAALYETGAQLFMTARELPKLEKMIDDIVSNSSSKNKNYPRPQSIEIMFDSLASVRKGADQIKTRTNRVSLLINNAGIMAVPQGMTQDGFELHFGINYLGHFLLFQLLKPLLLNGVRDSGDISRVVNLSSGSHALSGIRFDDINFEEPDSYQKFLAYGQSKTALIYMANSITRLFGHQGIVGLSVHPGVIRTNLYGYLADEERMKALDMVPSNLFKNGAQGAATTVWAALSPHFADVENTGRYLGDCGEAEALPKGTLKPGKPVYAHHAYDKEKEDRLWKISDEFVGLPESS